MKDSDYRSLSLWHETHPGPLEPRPPLVTDETVDVAIVGAGYTGLWTAYYLKELEPGIRVAIVEAEIAGFGDVAIVGAGYTGLWTAYYLKELEPGIRVAIVEAEIAGFGASGRNGGWCIGALAGMDAHFADPARREAAMRLQRAMFESVDEVGRVCEREGIDCHYAKGGSVSFASVEPHRRLLRNDLEHWRGLGFGDQDFRWLEADECATRVGATRNLGGLFFAHCAAIHPSHEGSPRSSRPAASRSTNARRLAHSSPVAS
jgi:glycine/D-amino acid oxidase-like deaminating enzyme